MVVLGDLRFTSCKYFMIKTSFSIEIVVGSKCDLYSEGCGLYGECLKGGLHFR